MISHLLELTHTLTSTHPSMYHPNKCACLFVNDRSIQLKAERERQEALLAAREETVRKKQQRDAEALLEKEWEAAEEARRVEKVLKLKKQKQKEEEEQKNGKKGDATAAAAQEESSSSSLSPRGTESRCRNVGMYLIFWFLYTINHHANI